MVAWKIVGLPSTRRSTAGTRAPLTAWALTATARVATVLTGRLEIDGATALPARLPEPFLIAANHTGIFDTAVLLAACHRVGIAPRFVTNGGLFDTPVLGTLLRRAGHLRVDPYAAGCAVRDTALLPEVHSGRPVLIYPEGRISRDPDLWPDRGQTGLARLALATGLPVLPIAQWGAHEVIPAATPPVRGVTGFLQLTRVWTHALHPLHRTVFRVRIGSPVDLGGLRIGRTGDAMRAHARIMQAITEALVPLRVDEPGPPRVHDPTRVTGRPGPWRPVPPGSATASGPRG